MNKKNYRKKEFKNFIRIAFVILSAFCFTACSSNSGKEKSDQSLTAYSNTENTFAMSLNPQNGKNTKFMNQADTSDSLLGTYWKAVKYEYLNWENGETIEVKLPTEIRWADLFINADGTVLFRDVTGEGFNYYVDDAVCIVENGKTLRLAKKESSLDLMV